MARKPTLEQQFDRVVRKLPKVEQLVMKQYIGEISRQAQASALEPVFQAALQQLAESDREIVMRYVREVAEAAAAAERRARQWNADQQATARIQLEQQADERRRQDSLRFGRSGEVPFGWSPPER